MENAPCWPRIIGDDDPSASSGLQAVGIQPRQQPNGSKLKHKILRQAQDDRHSAAIRANLHS